MEDPRLDRDFDAIINPGKPMPTFRRWDGSGRVILAFLDCCHIIDTQTIKRLEKKGLLPKGK
jgi:hypothetical protein